MAASIALSRRPQRTWSALSAVICLFAAVACGNDDPGGDNPTDGATQLPVVVPTPTTDLTASTPSEFPATAQEYAEAAVAAWAAPDLIRLSELADPAVHDQLLELPGPPDRRWRSDACERTEPAETAETASPAGDDPAEATTSVCSFHNSDGDQLRLTVTHQLLGAPRAVVDMGFEATSFPAEARDYVAEFLDAWQVGNAARMHALALSHAVETFQRLDPAPQVSYEVDETTDRVVTVLIVLIGAPAGDEPPEPRTEVTAQLSLALLGEPEAIRQATVTSAPAA